MPSPPRQQKRCATLSQEGREFWNRCGPITGDALAYLKARHCRLPPTDGDLRSHPSLKHPSGYVGPAIVALVTDAITSEPLTLHRTWIRADGAKPDVEPPRMLLAGHRKQGGVIRLWPDDAISFGLAVAEGIESALAGVHWFAPVWSAIDAGNLAGLPVLAGIESLIVFADHDAAGLKAAWAVGERWADAGREVSIVQPKRQGFDIADVVAS